MDETATPHAPPVPWWAAPAQAIPVGGATAAGGGDVVAVGTQSMQRGAAGVTADIDVGTASAAGAFGCDILEAGGRGRRRGGNPSPALLPAEAAAPETCVDARGLQLALAASPRVCVAFTASWCAPCVRFHPKYLDLSADFPDVAFVTVDVDVLDDATLDLLGVETVPTFLLMRRGKEVTRLSGVAHKRPAKKLAAAIRDHLLRRAQT